MRLAVPDADVVADPAAGYFGAEIDDTSLVAGDGAWLGGLRLMVMGINENRVLCTLQSVTLTGCSVHRTRFSLTLITISRSPPR